MPRKAVLVNCALSLLTAILLLALFPRFNIHSLAPVALTPLLVALARTPRAGQRFIFGWGTGIVFWFGLCTWIQSVLEVHGGMGRWGGWGCFFLFAVLKGLHLAVFSALAGPLLSRVYALPAVAALWVGLERTHGTFGFAWLALGNAGINMSVPLRLAPFVGVYGLSFVFAMLATAVAVIVLRYRRTYLWPLLGLLLLFVLPNVPEGRPAPDRAVVIQPNVDPEADWTPSLQQQTLKQLTFLSQALPGPLVIWPELPAPLYYDDPAFHQAAATIAKQHGSFLFDTVSFTPSRQPLNSAVTLGPDGGEVSRYNQIFLVPFGEFVPPLFSFVNRITHEAGDFVPGDKIVTSPASGHKLGAFICYESAFPHLVRQFSKAGADVLVNLSNDGYFGHSEAREQHLSLVRMRAVENRRFIIRSTNNGITAVIDPAGRVRKRLPEYQQAAAQINYGGEAVTTFYARHGDWFAWGCLIAGLLLSAVCFWQAGRGSQSAVADRV